MKIRRKAWLTAVLVSVSLFGQNADWTTFDFRSKPSFKHYRRVIQDYAREYRPAKSNSFCAVGIGEHSKNKEVMIIWKEGHEIISWAGEERLDFCPGTVDLKTDVVATDDDLNGSTNRVTRAWVNRVTQTCDRSGVKIVVPAAATSKTVLPNP